MKTETSCQCGGGHGMKKACNKSWALLVLRLAAGAIFLIHGYGKLFGNAPGMEGFTGMLLHLGFPMPSFWAYLVAVLEFFGGIALILGLFVKKLAPLFVIDMLVAWGIAKKFALPMGDPDLALLSITIALSFMGAGKFSLLAWLKKSPHTCSGKCSGGSCHTPTDTTSKSS